MKFFHSVSLYLLGVFLACSCTKSDKQSEHAPLHQADRPPNIIWIMADDLGYGDLGSYGQKHIRTPYLDRMAAEGTRFTQFYAGHAVCAPTRSSLMTGQHTGFTRIRGNWSAVTGERIPLAPEDTTVAQILQGAGYSTGLIGKWGLGEPGSSGVPWLKGFDYFWGFLNQARAHTFYPEWVWRNENRVILTGNRDVLDIYPEWKVYPLEENEPPVRTQAQYSHDLDMQEAKWFVRANREGPFFLYLALQIPHAELVVPDYSLHEYLDENGNSIFDEVQNSDVYGTRYAYTDKPIATYAAMVTRMDRDIGELLDLLRELGIAENTLVLFTSDNGTHAEGGYDPNVLNSSGSLRGIKRDLYEGGIRVPMIAWMPGTVPAGRVSEQVWAMWDFLPTAAELAGTRPTQATNGLSMVNALSNKPQIDHEYLYWEFLQRDESRQAVRMGNWKAVRYGHDKPTELYDLSVDIGEEIDLASSHPDIVERAEMLFRTARTHSEHYPLRVDLH
jgi:arylsulfatase A-like enzyme